MNRPDYSTEFARQAYRRQLDAQQTALSAAQILERFASERQPIAPSRLLAVAQKIKRETHEE